MLEQENNQTVLVVDCIGPDLDILARYNHSLMTFQGERRSDVFEGVQANWIWVYYVLLKKNRVM